MQPHNKWLRCEKDELTFAGLLCTAKAFCPRLFLLIQVLPITERGESLTDFTVHLCWKMSSHYKEYWSKEVTNKQQNRLRILQHSFLSKTSNKILEKWKWFCTNQRCTQIHHTPICLLAKHRNLENQVRKEQNYPAAVTAAHIYKQKCNSLLFHF